MTTVFHTRLCEKIIEIREITEEINFAKQINASIFLGSVVTIEII